MVDITDLKSVVLAGVPVQVRPWAPKERRNIMETTSINNMTPEEWLQHIPCKLYDQKEKKSYLIIAVSQEGLWYHHTMTLYDEDAYFGDGSYQVDCPQIMKYDALTTDFIFGQEPTEKQINWLEKHDLMTDSMTKQEAWLIINNAVREARQYHKERQQARMRRYLGSCLDSMFDDDAIMSQCGGGIDEFDDWM